MSELQIIKEEIAKVMGVANNKDWKIICADVKAGFYLSHFEEFTPISDESRSVRGTIVAMPERLVVANTFGFTTNALVKTIIFDEDGLMRVTDQEGFSHALDIKTTVFKKNYEGIMLRIFRFAGKTHFATSKKIISTKTNDANNPATTYVSMGGPSDKLLFSDYDTSPFCHSFLISDPKYVYCGRLTQSKFLVYMGASKMWEQESLSADQKTRLGKIQESPIYPQTLCDSKLITIEKKTKLDKIQKEINEKLGSSFQLPTVSMSKISLKDGDSKMSEARDILVPCALTLDEANLHLKQGYNTEKSSHKDERLGDGESILAYCYDQNGKFEKMVRLISYPHSWRMGIVDSNNNIQLRFFSLTDDINKMYIICKSKKQTMKKTVFDFHGYKDKYPIIKPKTKTEMIEELRTNGLIRFESMETSEINAYLLIEKNRLNNIWFSFLAAIAPVHQFEALVYKEEIDRMKELIINTMIGHLGVEKDNIKLIKFYKLVKDTMKRNKHNTQKGKVISFPEEVIITVGKLKGEDIYGIARSIEKYKGELIRRAITQQGHRSRPISSIDPKSRINISAINRRDHKLLDYLPEGISLEDDNAKPHMLHDKLKCTYIGHPQNNIGFSPFITNSQWSGK